MRRLNWLPGRGSGKRGARRPRVKPVWRQPTLIAGVLFLAATAAGGGSWWVWQQGWIQDEFERAKWKAIAGSARSGFSVREIFVEGRVETNKDKLLHALRMKRGAPILTFDPQAARARVEALPWISSAVIERQLPDVIHMRLVERRPLAIWQNKSRFTLIDTGGQPIPIGNMGRFSNLVIVVGKDAPRHAAQLLDVLATEPKLAKRVKAAVRVGGRRWNLHLDNSVSIKLPEKNAIEAWVQLAELQRNDKLLEKDISIVDLRLPDRVIVRQIPGSEKDAAKKFLNLPLNVKPGHET